MLDKCKLYEYFIENLKTVRYCIGDVHGCIKTLVKLVNLIVLSDSKPEIYFVGDIIDRGPDSKSVIDYILELKVKGFLHGLVRGNHEEMLMQSYLKNQTIYDSIWHLNGAINTLLSFNTDYKKNSKITNLIPANYFMFLNSLPYYIELNDYFIVHAGLNIKNLNPFNDTETMLWTRNEDYNNIILNEKKIIHGHTPIPFESIKNNIQEKNNINIDSGCVYVNKEGLGSLTAINLDTLELINIKNIDF